MISNVIWEWVDFYYERQHTVLIWCTKKGLIHNKNAGTVYTRAALSIVIYIIRGRLDRLLPIVGVVRYNNTKWDNCRTDIVVVRARNFIRFSRDRLVSLYRANIVTRGKCTWVLCATNCPVWIFRKIHTNPARETHSRRIPRVTRLFAYTTIKW